MAAVAAAAAAVAAAVAALKNGTIHDGIESVIRNILGNIGGTGNVHADVPIPVLPVSPRIVILTLTMVYQICLLYHSEGKSATP